MPNTPSETADAANETIPGAPAPEAAPPRRVALQKRVREWIQVLHRDPSAEERAASERRAHLLVQINQAVAEAPDDIPIKDLVARLNRHNAD